MTGLQTEAGPQFRNKQGPNLIVLLTAIVIIEAYAQYCAKRSYITREKQFLVYAFLLYGTTAIILYMTYRYSTMGIVNVMWNAGSTIMIVLLGIYFFREKINRWDSIGIILILIGMWMIYTKGETSTS